METVRSRVARANRLRLSPTSLTKLRCDLDFAGIVVAPKPTETPMPAFVGSAAAPAVDLATMMGQTHINASGAAAATATTFIAPTGGDARSVGAILEALLDDS